MLPRTSTSAPTLNYTIASATEFPINAEVLLQGCKLTLPAEVIPIDFWCVVLGITYNFLHHIFDAVRRTLNLMLLDFAIVVQPLSMPAHLRPLGPARCHRFRGNKPE